ncbi:MAG TPA: hypothetical protein VJM53_07945 [Burkholderiales bacterium]|jgi:TPR repeat protein|nr:hypothetical protein [Burkholderiales bacterium]
MNEEFKACIATSRQLCRDGKRDAARQLLLEATEEGSIDAMIELADMALGDGNRSESDFWMDSAEQILGPHDEDGRISLSGAYAIGLGSGTREEQEGRALDHLLAIAGMGNTVAQERVAVYYLHGLNGCVKDERKFEHWIGEAMAAGSPNAAFFYGEHLLRSDRPIPVDVVDLLEEGKLTSKRIRALLRAIARRAKSHS